MFKDLNTINNRNNITEMTRDTTDHLTLGDLFAFTGGEHKAIRICSIDVDYDLDRMEPELYYIETSLGTVVMPRHLNYALDIFMAEDYYQDMIDRGELGIIPFKYQFGDRFGYSVTFVKTPSWWDDVMDEIKKDKAYTNWNNGVLEECEYTGKPCFEHDCDLCPYNPYQE